MAFAHRSLSALGLALLAATASAAPPTTACRVAGISTEVQCGAVTRPLDPAEPGGKQIEVHYLVVPALARNKLPDPVLFLAGGPGQSAIKLASKVLPRLARLNNRRDLVFVDQRGTGASAPLECPDDDARSVTLADSLDMERQYGRLEQCRTKLEALPYGDLRQFTTTIAMQDVDAVRAALGAERWNLVGGSYGTRAALEYLRQFPQHVRRTVIDGVAPPDMVLPASMTLDAQAALDAVFKACAADKACAARYPRLEADWQALLARLPLRVTVADPRSGVPQSVVIEQAALLSLVRAPLYAPALAAGLPAAIDAAAAHGRFEGLLGLGSGLGGGDKDLALAMGMHYAVICAEDVPRLDAAAVAASPMAAHYARVCKTWPRGAPPADFYRIPRATTPVLLLSGGADPVTPPRHAARVAAALGPLAQPVVVPQSGHGVMGIACMSDVLYRFVDAADAARARPVDAACATAIPRPPAYLPPRVAGDAGDNTR